MVSRNVRTEQDREALIRFVNQLPLPMSVSIGRGASRSLDQRGTAESKVAALEADVERLREALVDAHQFITNGLEFGFIQMPRCHDDPAHSTLPRIRSALSSTPEPPRVEERK